MGVEVEPWVQSRKAGAWRAAEGLWGRAAPGSACCVKSGVGMPSLGSTPPQPVLKC